MESYLAALGFRSLLFAGAVLLGLAAGEPVAKFLRLPELLALFARATRRLGEKLNKRDAATRAWRGLITVGMVALPALLLGFVLQRNHLLQLIIIALGVGTALSPYHLLRQWQQAGTGALTLQSQGYLFADTHGLLRHSVLGQATGFAIAVTGFGFWYVIGGMPLGFVYLALALTAAHYTPELAAQRVFGTPAAMLFQWADALPRRLAAFLFATAGLFVPGCKPYAAAPIGLAAPTRWSEFLARLLHIALGGSTRTATGPRDRGWVGPGTARLDNTHLTRFMALFFTTNLLAILTLLAVWLFTAA